MLIGADALDVAHRAGAESRAGAIGDAQVHRHADQRHVEAAEVRQRDGVRAERRAEKGGRIRERPLAPLRVAEQLLPDRGKFRIEDVAALRIRVLAAQSLQFVLVQSVRCRRRGVGDTMTPVRLWWGRRAWVKRRNGDSHGCRIKCASEQRARSRVSVVASSANVPRRASSWNGERQRAARSPRR